MDFVERRASMVARLRDTGVITSASVEQAMLSVARERFVPAVDVDVGYDDRAVIVKRSELGEPTSSVSQPTIVATMLESLAVQPGDRVLEIGTGPGYNAALLARLAGTDGRVVSVEIDPALAQQARDQLALVGAGEVDVVCGDGRQGHAATVRTTGSS